MKECIITGVIIRKVDNPVPVRCTLHPCDLLPLSPTGADAVNSISIEYLDPGDCESLCEYAEDGSTIHVAGKPRLRTLSLRPDDSGRFLLQFDGGESRTDWRSGSRGAKAELTAADLDALRRLLTFMASPPPAQPLG